MNLTLREKSKNNELGYSKNKLTLFEHESIAAKQVEVLESVILNLSSNQMSKRKLVQIFFFQAALKIKKFKIVKNNQIIF
jgi:hypothetical protein